MLLINSCINSDFYWIFKKHPHWDKHSMQVIKTTIELKELIWEDLGSTGLLVTCLGVCLLYRTWAGHMFSWHFFLWIPRHTIYYFYIKPVLLFIKGIITGIIIRFKETGISSLSIPTLYIFFLKVHKSKMIKSKPWIHRVTWLYHQLQNSKHSLPGLYCLNRIEINIDNNGKLVCKHTNKFGINYNSLNVCQETKCY